jgi:hypothetical protein
VAEINDSSSLGTQSSQSILQRSFLPILYLFCYALFPEIFQLIACIFSGIFVPKYFRRSATCKNESVEAFSIIKSSYEWKCQRFLTEFSSGVSVIVN